MTTKKLHMREQKIGPIVCLIYDPTDPHGERIPATLTLQLSYNVTRPEYGVIASVKMTFTDKSKKKRKLNGDINERLV